MQRALLLAALASLVLAHPVHAAVPSPANSSVDPCLIVCPLSDFDFDVVVRDANNNPVVNSSVVVDWCQCPVTLCGPRICFASGVTDATGFVRFQIMAGGVCPANPSATIRADGVLLATRPVASPDQDGNLIVDGTDYGIAASKLNTSDPTAELDCDSGTPQMVTQSDLDELEHHMGHSCTGVVPTLPWSWGSVKLLYR